MKKNLVLLLALISIFYQATKVQAGTLLEPYVGTLLSSTGEFNSDDLDITGTTVGARVGFQQMGVMLGLDGRRTSANFEDSDSDSDYTITQLGLFAGYDFPVMVRVWGTYVFSVEGVDDDDTDTKITSGSGTTFGVGYKFFPFLSANLEMSNLKTSKYETELLGEQDLDGDYTIYTLSISLPLSL